MEYEDLFTDENKPTSNWFKFDNVGDKVAGKLVSVSEKEASGQFPAQRVYTIEQGDGLTVNVGISLKKDYVNSRASQARIGDILGFKFVKEIPPKTKGLNPAKSIEVYVKKVEEIDF